MEFEWIEYRRNTHQLRILFEDNVKLECGNVYTYISGNDVVGCIVVLDLQELSTEGTLEECKRRVEAHTLVALTNTVKRLSK